MGPRRNASGHASPWPPLRWGGLPGLAMLAACAQAPEDSAARARRQLPPGLLVCGQARPARTLLRDLQALDQTPVARLAADLEARLTGCDGFIAGPGDQTDALTGAAVRCAEPGLECAALTRTLTSRAVAFSWNPPEAPSIRGWLDVDADGTLRARARWAHPAGAERLSLLRPAQAPPGPAVLSDDGAVLHARWRSAGGLDLAAMVPPGGDLDHLVGLRGQLFEKGVLDGTLEPVIYPPEPGHGVPAVALGLGFHARVVAVTAMRRFVGGIGENWRVFPSPFAVGEAEGQCLLALNVMPEFAPCWVATEDSLVVGWNGAALERALATPGPADLGTTHTARVRFDDWGEAERRMALAAGFSEDTPRTAWPWRAATLQATAGEAADQVRLALDAGGSP